MKPEKSSFRIIIAIQQSKWLLYLFCNVSVNSFEKITVDEHVNRS